MSSFPHSLARSFHAAWRGLLIAFRAERTFRVMIAGALVVAAGVSVLPLERWERILLLLLTGAVLVLELLNSAAERLADLLKPRLSAYVGELKDLMAAAVLVASLLSVIVAGLILLPHTATIFRQF